VSLTIRSAAPADAQRIAEFNGRLAEETEAKVLDAPTVFAGVQALLESPEDGQYFIAESDADIVGQLLITYEWSDWRNGRFWWIQSVYVAPAHRRKGVFSRLYEHVAALARTDSAACGLRLYVEESNARALETYRALGMHLAGYQVLEVEFD